MTIIDIVASLSHNQVSTQFEQLFDENNLQYIWNVGKVITFASLSLCHIG